jgi:ElaB/YqjD/DUF883 family membrane-anchored ribosome-binding protein
VKKDWDRYVKKAQNRAEAHEKRMKKRITKVVKRGEHNIRKHPITKGH